MLLQAKGLNTRVTCRTLAGSRCYYCFPIGVDLRVAKRIASVNTGKHAKLDAK